MAALANKIGNDPVLLPLLDIFNSQRRQFGSPQAAAQQDGECGVVSLSAKAANLRTDLGVRLRLILLRAI